MPSTVRKASTQNEHAFVWLLVIHSRWWNSLPSRRGLVGSATQQAGEETTSQEQVKCWNPTLQSPPHCGLWRNKGPQKASAGKAYIKTFWLNDYYSLTPMRSTSCGSQENINKSGKGFHTIILGHCKGCLFPSSNDLPIIRNMYFWEKPHNCCAHVKWAKSPNVCGKQPILLSR